MKFWVLEVVVVEGDEDGKADEEDGDEAAGECGTGVAEGGVAGEGGGVDHGEFVDELHGVCCVVSKWLSKHSCAGLGDVHFSVPWKRKLPKPMTLQQSNLEA